jgi:hypothetical protein
LAILSPPALHLPSLGSNSVKNYPENLPTAYTGIMEKIKIRASCSARNKILKVLMIPDKDGSVIEADSGFQFAGRCMYRI